MPLFPDDLKIPRDLHSINYLRLHRQMEAEDARWDQILADLAVEERERVDAYRHEMRNQRLRERKRQLDNERKRLAEEPKITPVPRRDVRDVRMIHLACEIGESAMSLRSYLRRGAGFNRTDHPHYWDNVVKLVEHANDDKECP